jgi:hypothetical protein
VHRVIDNNSNPYRNMVMDVMRMNQGHADQCPIIDEEPIVDVAKFFFIFWKILTNHYGMVGQITVNYRHIQVFTIKSNHELSGAGYDKIIEWVRNILFEMNRLKENFYAAKSMMKPLSIGYQKIELTLV